MYDEDDYPDDPDYPDYPNYPEYPQLPRQPYPSSPRFYAESLGGVLQALTEYARTLEHEKSNRTDIERKRSAALSVIRSQRRTMLAYLSSRFGERGALYEQYFKLIDTALELQNEEIVRLALESILNIYQDNPGGGLEEFRQQFEAISEAARI
jgi:ribosomal protein S15P/S13E